MAGEDLDVWLFAQCKQKTYTYVGSLYDMEALKCHQLISSNMKRSWTMDELF